VVGPSPCGAPHCEITNWISDISDNTLRSVELRLPSVTRLRCIILWTTRSLGSCRSLAADYELRAGGDISVGGGRDNERNGDFFSWNDGRLDTLSRCSGLGCSTRAASRIRRAT
jgi:hypothetical protein